MKEEETDEEKKVRVKDREKVQQNKKEKSQKESRKCKKWIPKCVNLLPKRIYTDEKEKIMTELANIIYDMQKNYLNRKSHEQVT